MFIIRYIYFQIVQNHKKKRKTFPPKNILSLLYYYYYYFCRRTKQLSLSELYIRATIEQQLHVLLVVQGEEVNKGGRQKDLWVQMCSHAWLIKLEEHHSCSRDDNTSNMCVCPSRKANIPKSGFIINLAAAEEEMYNRNSFKMCT